MENFDFLYFMLIIFGILLFKKFSNHILVILISMEFLVSITILLMMKNYIMIEVEELFLLYFLVFSVCDSVIGLSLIVMLNRDYGNEKLKILNFKVW